MCKSENQHMKYPYSTNWANINEYNMDIPYNL